MVTLNQKPYRDDKEEELNQTLWNWKRQHAKPYVVPRRTLTEENGPNARSGFSTLDERLADKKTEGCLQRG